ncbi:MAG: hypothetical protein ACLP7Q_27165 [Isosphaeraceae bacterium]
MRDVVSTPSGAAREGVGVSLSRPQEEIYVDMRRIEGASDPWLPAANRVGTPIRGRGFDVVPHDQYINHLPP